MRNVLTVVIHTYNEEKNIQACIDSARLLTDLIVVIDMESTDDTAGRAASAGAAVFNFPYRRYVEPARQFGIGKVQTSWFLILDADERVTEELSREIKISIGQSVFTHYKIPRQNIFAGKKWLQHGGWYPDYQIRLIQKSAFVAWGSQIHAPPEIRGEVGLLKRPLLHYFHPALENMVEKTINYEEIEAELLFQAGRRTGVLTFGRKFAGELWRRLIRQAGFLDGPLGVIESVYQAFSKTITYLFLYEKNRRR